MSAFLEITFLAFPLLMAFAAVSDLLTFRIPNLVPLLGVAGFTVAAQIAGFDVGTIGLHVGVGLAALAAGLVLFARGWVGGGDAKIAAVAVLWVGPAAAPQFIAWTLVAGGLLTVATIAVRRQPLPAFAIRTWTLRLHDPRSGIPYGIAIGAAALAVYPQTWTALLLA
ncbi:MAG: prepilin peptidase [Bauldia sp.]